MAYEAVRLQQEAIYKSQEEQDAATRGADLKSLRYLFAHHQGAGDLRHHLRQWFVNDGRKIDEAMIDAALKSR